MTTLHRIAPSRTSADPAVQESTQAEAMIERALALLADLERRYEQERSIIEGALHPQPWKDWRLEQLSYRYNRERQPLVQRLCALHHSRTMATIGLSPVGADMGASGTFTAGVPGSGAKHAAGPATLH